MASHVQLLFLSEELLSQSLRVLVFTFSRLEVPGKIQLFVFALFL